jgi:formylmethanofuran dehydrogenase subunit D
VLKLLFLEAFTMTRIHVTLLTGRSLSQGRTKEHGKLSEVYLQAVACCEVNTADLEKISITHGQNIRVITEHGSVVVKAIAPTQLLPQGIIFMPYSLWATQLSGSDTDGTGMPSYKGVPATLEPATDEKILSVNELVTRSFGKSH